MHSPVLHYTVLCSECTIESPIAPLRVQTYGRSRVCTYKQKPARKWCLYPYYLLAMREKDNNNSSSSSGSSSSSTNDSSKQYSSMSGRVNGLNLLFSASPLLRLFLFGFGVYANLIRWRM